MRRSSFLFRERIPGCDCRKAAVLLLLLCSSLAILVAPRDSSSHEPVTTKVMFNREIVRIFQRHCLVCHDSGNITNISLATYPQARPWAKAFKEEVLEKRMPPYQAVKGFGDFRNDYTMTQHEIDQIVSWVEGGAPKGDDDDLPKPAIGPDDWALGRPDLILETKKEANISSGDAPEYRCVVLPTNLKGARWLTGIDFRPGSGVVHCASFGIESRRPNADSSGCGAQSGSKDEALGLLGTWMPGQTLRALPKNVARLLPAGSRIVLRIHYQKGSEAAISQSALGLYLASGPGMKPLHTLTLAAAAQDVPAGPDLYRVKLSYTMREAAEAITIRPLLFPLAKSVEVTARRPDGSVEVLVWARDYRYDWQPEYNFKKPVPLPAGTAIEVTAYLDNSDNNPNNPNRPARSIRFASGLCELSFVKATRKIN